MSTVDEYKNVVLFVGDTDIMCLPAITRNLNDRNVVVLVSDDEVVCDAISLLEDAPYFYHCKGNTNTEQGLLVLEELLIRTVKSEGNVVVTAVINFAGPGTVFSEDYKQHLIKLNNSIGHLHDAISTTTFITMSVETENIDEGHDSSAKGLNLIRTMLSEPRELNLSVNFLTYTEGEHDSLGVDQWIHEILTRDEKLNIVYTIAGGSVTVLEY